MKRFALLGVLVSCLLISSSSNAVDLRTMKLNFKSADDKFVTLFGTAPASGVEKTVRRSLGVTVGTKAVCGLLNWRFGDDDEVVIDQKTELALLAAVHAGHAYVTEDGNLATRLLATLAAFVGYDYVVDKLKKSAA